MKLAARVASSVLANRDIAPESLDALILGITVHQRQSFYGVPWLAGMIGATNAIGPTISQACATSARVVAAAALEVESGQRETALAIACDRTSNGPHVYYPNPNGTVVRNLIAVRTPARAWMALARPGFNRGLLEPTDPLTTRQSSQFR